MNYVYLHTILCPDNRYIYLVSNVPITHMEYVLFGRKSQRLSHHLARPYLPSSCPITHSLCTVHKYIYHQPPSLPSSIILLHPLLNLLHLIIHHLFNTLIRIIIRHIQIRAMESARDNLHWLIRRARQRSTGPESARHTGVAPGVILP